MKRLMIACSLLLLLSSTGAVLGEILSNTSYTLDLTNAKEAAKRAKWSEPERVIVTAQGLGWGQGGEQGSRDFWLETEPIAIGLSWRPTSIAVVKATIDKPGTSGLLYARYSADGKHWTTWQHLEEATPAAPDGATQVFSGTLRVPYRERAPYTELRLEYARRDDVPWSSDEEALVKDILKREPKFFEKSTPLIGYVQFLYEAQLHDNQRIKELKLEISWQVGGKHIPPKNEKDWEGRDGAWRFKAP
jgi:hypothetical protein